MKEILEYCRAASHWFVKSICYLRCPWYISAPASCFVFVLESGKNSTFLSASNIEEENDCLFNALLDKHVTVISYIRLC